MNKEDTLIKDIRIYQAVSKLSHPIADSTHDISKIAFYVLEVETKGGVIGQGYLLSFHFLKKIIMYMRPHRFRKITRSRVSILES